MHEIQDAYPHLWDIFTIVISFIVTIVTTAFYLGGAKQRLDALEAAMAQVAIWREKDKEHFEQEIRRAVHDLRSDLHLMSANSIRSAEKIENSIARVEARIDRLSHG